MTKQINKTNKIVISLPDSFVYFCSIMRKLNKNQATFIKLCYVQEKLKIEV